MRIGLFTDTYRPSINGIVYVVESTKTYLESQGHEVFIFCPARSMRPSVQAQKFDEDEHVVRFPSVKGVFYDEYDTALFFPPSVNRTIRDLDLDLIHFFTPGQIGLMGVFAAGKNNVPLVAQHCTDLYQYVQHYSDRLLLTGLLALIAMVPFSMKVDRHEMKQIMKIYRPRRSTLEWNRDLVEKIVTLVYARCDAVIALSRKSKLQLESWQHEKQSEYPVTLWPNGVNKLPAPSKSEIQRVREGWGFGSTDPIIGFVGRLGTEKNLALLIPALKKAKKDCPTARLVIVGGGEMSETLRGFAHEEALEDSVILTGPLPRETLGAVYANFSVFAFPSQTDTQGWVLHEAAYSGIPLVLIDQGLSEVIEPGVNGLYARDNPNSLARQIIEIISNSDKQKAFGIESKRLAARYTEARQFKKLLTIYDQAIERYAAKTRR